MLRDILIPSIKAIRNLPEGFASKDIEEILNDLNLAKEILMEASRR